MSQTVVDTDVASYIFNWHTLAQRYSDVLEGPNFSRSCPLRNCEWVRSLRPGAAVGASPRAVYPWIRTGLCDHDLCTVWTRVRVDARGAGHSVDRTAGSRRQN